jgi:hypothetical protein
MQRFRVPLRALVAMETIFIISAHDYPQGGPLFEEIFEIVGFDRRQPPRCTPPGCIDGTAAMMEVLLDKLVQNSHISNFSIL